MTKIADYQFDLFGRNVLAAFGCGELEAISAFNEHLSKKSGGKFNNTFTENLNDAQGWCQHRNGDIYIWAEESPSTLYHEIVHAAFKLCEVVGVGIDEELIARLVQQMKIHIADELIKEKPKKSRKS